MAKNGSDIDSSILFMNLRYQMDPFFSKKNRKILIISHPNHPISSTPIAREAHSPQRIREAHFEFLGEKKRMEFFSGASWMLGKRPEKNRGNDLMDLTCFSHDSTGLNQPRWNEQPPFWGGDHRIEPSIFSGYDSVWRMRWFCHHKWHRALYFSVVGELSCWNTSGFGGLILRQTYWGLAQELPNKDWDGVHTNNAIHYKHYTPSKPINLGLLDEKSWWLNIFSIQIVGGWCSQPFFLRFSNKHGNEICGLKTIRMGMFNVVF